MLRLSVFGGYLQAAAVRGRAFHSCSIPQARQKHMRRLNRLHKHWAQQMFNKQDDWVDPVLGRPEVPFLLRLQALVNQPENQIDLLEPESTSKLLFKAKQVPPLRPAGQPNEAQHSGSDAEDSENLKKLAKEQWDAVSEQKREAVLRIVSLQNTNNQQRQRQAVLLARKEFERFEGDTGSPEVQAAVATVRIHAIAAHAKQNKQDVQTKRRLEHMVQTRRNMLLYLRRVEPKRYIWAIEKLGLSDSSVREEFHMSRRYLWRTQFYGDKTLPLKKTVKDTKKQREYAARRAKAERYLSQHDPEALIKLA